MDELTSVKKDDLITMVLALARKMKILEKEIILLKRRVQLLGG